MQFETKAEVFINCRSWFELNSLLGTVSPQNTKVDEDCFDLAELIFLPLFLNLDLGII